LDARIDTGVREVVEQLSRIRGVTTRASCEGLGQGCLHHRHAYWAYVLFRQPLPLRFREFLVAQIGSVARVEEDGIYSRWRERNGEFLSCLVTAVRRYASQETTDQGASIRWRLPKLRARLARALADGQAIRLQLCLQCRDLVLGDHLPSHERLALLLCPADRPTVWFAEFESLPPNVLEADLVETDGWAKLIARTQRGEFGTAFQRRWLRFRARKLAELATRHLRIGAELARRQRPDLDFFYSDTHATFEWQPDRPQILDARGETPE
jgi:hypothetical protein